jgi:hypothetical protein
MSDHNGVLMVQRMLFAGMLGLAMARRAAAILEGEPTPVRNEPIRNEPARNEPARNEPADADGAVLRAILDAANDCLGQFDGRPAAERWCDTLSYVLDLAAFAAETGGPSR